MNRKLVFSLAVLSLAILLIGTIPQALGDEDERKERKAEDEKENERKEKRERKEKEDCDGGMTYREFYANFSDEYDDETLKRVFEAADSNDDDKLSKREIIRAKLLLLKVDVKEKMRNFQRPDRDGDGVITYREFYSFLEGKFDNQTIKRVFEAADGDDDGELSRREQLEAFKLLSKVRASQVREKVRERIRDDKEEKDDDEEDEKERKHSRIGNLLKRMDRDQDGKLTLREILSALRAIRKARSA